MIKLKSKNQRVIEMWAKAINGSVEELNDLKIRIATYKCSINIEGSFLKARVYITNDAISISRGGKVVMDLPRFPVTTAAPNLNDPKKIHIYKNGVLMNTVICDTVEATRRLLIALNSKPDELKTIPEFFITDTNIPDIPDVIFENIENDGEARTTEIAFNDEDEEGLDLDLDVPEEEEAAEPEVNEEENENENNGKKEKKKKFKKIVKIVKKMKKNNSERNDDEKTDEKKEKKKKKGKRKSRKNSENENKKDNDKSENESQKKKSEDLSKVIEDTDNEVSNKEEKETSMIAEENKQLEKKKNDLLSVKKENKTQKKDEKSKKKVKIETDFVPADKNPWPEEKSEISTTKKSESHLYNDPINFRNRMEEKLKKLKELPRNDKPPNINDLITAKSSQFGLKVKPGTYPDIFIPENTNESNIFQIPANDSTISLTAIGFQYKKPSKLLTIQDSFNFEEICSRFSKSQKGLINKIGFQPKGVHYNLYNEIMNEFKELPPAQQPIATASLFLHSRSKKVQDIGGKVKSINYTLKILQDKFHSVTLNTEEDFVNLFIYLYINNFIQFFFESVSNEQEFIQESYYQDAFMKCPSFCNDIVNYSKSVQGLEIVPNSIIYKDVYSPHVILSYAIPRFKNAITEILMLDESEKSDEPLSISLIVCSLIELFSISSKNNHRYPIDGDFAFLWRKISNLKSKLKNADLFKFKKLTSKEIKIITFMVQIIFDPSFMQFVNLVISDERNNPTVQAEIVLCIDQLSNIGILNTKIENQALIQKVLSDVKYFFHIDNK